MEPGDEFSNRLKRGTEEAARNNGRERSIRPLCIGTTESGKPLLNVQAIEALAEPILTAGMGGFDAVGRRE